VGRGASPHELEALGVDPAQAPQMYAEAFEILQLYFRSKTLNHQGKFWRFEDVPVEMQPLQQPHPPIWYALASPESTVWPARQGVHIVCGGPVERVRAITDRYREESQRALAQAVAEPLMGVNRYVVVADSDEAAREIGRRAWPVFYANFIKLWNKHGTQPVNAKLPPGFDQLLASGHAVAGSPATVTAQLKRQLEDGGLNYLIGSFVFGDMPHAVAVRSVQLFASEVMPALRELEHAAA